MTNAMTNNNPITMIIPIALAKGNSEADLLKASQHFEVEFASKQKTILRRELVKKSEGKYVEIVQFTSQTAIADIMEKEKTEPSAIAFFALLDPEGTDPDTLHPYESLVTY